MSTNGRCDNRLREVRRRRGLRQADLAREVGITRQTILAIEKGRLNPSVTIALKIARVLGEPIDYVFYLAAGPSESETIDTAKAPAPEPAAVPESAEPASVWDFG